MKLHRILFGVCIAVLTAFALYVHPILHIVPYILEKM